MPVLHFHVSAAHVKVPQPHFFLIYRTAKVIAGHFNLGWRTVALAARSLFSDRATLKSAYSALSNNRASLSSSSELSPEFRRSPRHRRVVTSIVDGRITPCRGRDNSARALRQENPRCPPVEGRVSSGDSRAPRLAGSFVGRRVTRRYPATFRSNGSRQRSTNSPLSCIVLAF